MFVADIAIGSHGAAPLSQLASKGVKNMIDVLSKWANDLAKLSPDVRGKFIRQLKTTFECATSVEIGNPEIYLRSSAGVCDELKAFFNHLFGEFGQDTRKLITDELSLLEVWKKYYKPGIEPKELEALLKRFPDQDDKFYEIFEQLFFESDGNGNFTLKDATAFDAFLEAMENVKLAAVLTKEGGSGVKAWDVVKHLNAQIRLDPPSLEALSKILKNPNKTALGLANEILGSIKGSQNLAYKDVIKTLDDFGLNIQGKNINLSDFNKVLNDLVKGDGWTDGAEWTLKYISSSADDFAGKSLKFEVYDKWDDVSGTYIRITDVVDETNSAFKVLYEFKSVKNVPPGKFNEQFIKDLSNPDVVDLDQIRWLFDGRKSPSDFKSNMTDAVNDLPLTKELAEKLLQNPEATISDLRNEILAKMGDIFKLVD